MRISSYSFSSNMLLNLNRNNVQFYELNNKIAQQTRILKPSDDPIASTQLALLRRDQAAINQYQTNIDRLKGNLAIQESKIKGIEEALLEVKDKLGETLGGTLSAEDMDGYGKELATMLEATIELINTRDQDRRYMFSGTKTDQQPLVYDEASQSWSYQGNQDNASTNVSNGMAVNVTTHLAQAFGGNLETINQLKAISAKMQDASIHPADYVDELQAVFNSVDDSHSKVAAIFTDLGGRQNNLTLLQDSHEDNALANDAMMGSLKALDMGQANIELHGYLNSTENALKSYAKIQSLSLFALI